MDLQCGKQRQMVKRDMRLCVLKSLSHARPIHTPQHRHNAVCVEKKSLRRIMYTAAHSPKPRVSVHLVFNCYKLSYLTLSSFHSTTGLEQSQHPGSPDSKLRSNSDFLSTVDLTRVLELKGDIMPCESLATNFQKRAISLSLKSFKEYSTRFERHPWSI